MMVVTKGEIVRGLRQLGLAAGHRVLVHSSLRSFGYVEGGVEAVIDALLEAVSPGGTVLVPTLTGDETLSPANPPVYDPLRTPCWTGRIPETFRQRPDAVRSLHPTHSVAAIGADAVALTQDHIDSVTPCDERSPYGKLTRREGSYILLIGVGHEVNTTFHCVEEMVGVEYHMQEGFAQATLIVNGEAITRHYMLHKYGPARNFPVMEPVFIERGVQRSTTIGQSWVRLVEAKGLFALAVRGLTADRSLLLAR